MSNFKITFIKFKPFIFVYKINWMFIWEKALYKIEFAKILKLRIKLCLLKQLTLGEYKFIVIKN
jgi:hypothetical protein